MTSRRTNLEGLLGGSLRVGGVACSLLVALALPASGQLSLGFSQRAADGTTYEVISVPNTALFGGADEFQVTTVAGSTIGLQQCSNSGGFSGEGTSALVGGDLGLNPAQQLHPYANIVRTGILVPNNETITFNSYGVTGSGRLTIGTGAGAVDVCLTPADCSSGAPNATLYPLSSSLGSVPVACIANAVPANCTSGTFSTFGFGLPMTGTTCNSAPTTNGTVCGARPGDGFTIQKGQMVVFVYSGGLANTGFTFGASGFGIDTDGVNNPTCSANRIVTAAATAPSAPPRPFAPPKLRAPALSWPVLLSLAAVLAGWGSLRLQSRKSV